MIFTDINIYLICLIKILYTKDYKNLCSLYEIIIFFTYLNNIIPEYIIFISIFVYNIIIIFVDKEYSNLDKFYNMIDEIKNNDNTYNFKHFLNPLTDTYWTINENKMIYKYLKNDNLIVKRCFVYLKKIKYLHKDIINLKYGLKCNKKKYLNLKRELITIKTQLKSKSIKLGFLTSTFNYTPKYLKFHKILDDDIMEINVVEDHYNEFKSKNILYDNNINNKINRFGLEQIIKSILGFLNADGGKLYIGIEDNGYISGVEFYNRIHLDNFMKQIDNTLTNVKPVIIDKFYDYEFWKKRKSIVIVINVIKQKEPKKRFTINGSKYLYVRSHTLTRKICI